MTGTLNNAVAARDFGYNALQVLRKRIQYTQNATAITIGKIPAGALIIKGLSGIVVHTVTNAGTQNAINVGYTRASGTDDDYFGTLLATTALNFVPLDETVTGYYLSEDTTITATMALTGTAATTGDLEVVIVFVTGGR